MSSEFKDKLRAHAEHIKKVRHLCTTEETTKQALILPLLDILGFSAFDPSKVRAEFRADFPGCKAGERVDYALFCNGQAVMFIEAKSCEEPVSRHSPQLSRYFNATPSVSICAVTNGRQWWFYTDLVDKNIMDSDAFLRIDLDHIDDNDAEQLYQFRHDSFQADNLRTLAEENLYLMAFTESITRSLQDVDIDFVRYVAQRSNINKQLNQRFLESITPLVSQAVQKSVGNMIMTGLDAAKTAKPITEEAKPKADAEINADIIDPTNSKIVTTQEETKLLEYVRRILGEESEIEAKDTESYYNILAYGKANRWVVRYFGDRKKPYIIFPLEISDEDKKAIIKSGLVLHDNGNIEIERPQDILRVSWLVLEAYQFCSNDENFKRKKE